MNDRDIPKILVVDDEPLVLDCIKNMIEKFLKCLVITAIDGSKGLDYFNNNRFALAIIDFSLPLMNGLQLLQEIRKRNMRIPVVIISGYCSSDLFCYTFRNGANCILQKPFSPKTLISVIFPLLIQDYPSLQISPGLSLEKQLCKENYFNHVFQYSQSDSRELLDCFLTNFSQPKIVNSSETCKPETNNVKQFCHAIVHSLKGEFMNVGNAIRSLYHDDSLSDDSREEINVLEESIQYCQLLTRRLIDFVDLGKASERDVNVVDILGKAKSLLAPRMPSTISFEINAPDDLPESTVRTDPEEILMVLVELVENAKRALSGREGSIQVQAQSLDDGSIQISVCDDGPGIPADVQKDLFKKQVASQSGTGFGLFLSSNVISSLGGEMSLQSSSETGTTITILLPVKELPQEPQT